MYRSVDVGMEDEILPISILVHEILGRLCSFSPVLMEAISCCDPMNNLKTLERRLLAVLDVVDAEMSMEKHLIHHLKLRKHSYKILEGYFDEYARASETAAMRTWIRTLRVTLDVINDAFKTFIYSSSQKEGIHHHHHHVPDDSITSTMHRITMLIAKLDDIIADRPPDPNQKIMNILELNGSFVLGRSEDENSLIGLLLGGQQSKSSSCLDDNVGVIPIVGDAGLGKTTLAKLVYNDPRVQGHFDLKMWVSFSECYPDVIRLTESLIKSANGNLKNDEKKKKKKKQRKARKKAQIKKSAVGDSTTPPLLDNDVKLEGLQSNLGKLLLGKRFLLVLDGVSNEICCDWNVLKVPFWTGANTSRILVTTRSPLVSSTLGTTSPYPLQPLSYEVCWSLFRHLAFGDSNNNISSTVGTPTPLPPPKLLQYCEEVVKSFRGYPSVVAAVGFLLRSCLRVEFQSRFLRRLRLYDHSTSPISSALLWTYHGLSSMYLKQCFVYCVLFPKGYIFEKHKLVLLWMAEGFLQPKEGTTLEDIGLAYFDELFKRSFLQFEDDYFIHDDMYVMPDPVHDLAEYISSSGDVYFKLDDYKHSPSSSSSKISEYARHSLLRCTTVGEQTFEAFYKSKGLHTLLLCDLDFKNCIQKVPQDLFLNLTRIYVLDLSHSGFSELPDSICHLTHLRFLDLSMNYIKHLPETMSRLHNLQTLRIISHVKILRFPRDMGKLVNLRHLDLGIGYQAFLMPPGIEKLVNLQTLHAFTMDGEFGRIEVLRKLVNLRSLLILKLENLWRDKEMSKGDCLVDKKYLHNLELVWSYKQDAEIAESILSCLQPHTNLKHLKVLSYNGLIFPAWIGNPSFSNLETVQLCDSQNCEFLPPLGQLPLLKSLLIYGHMDELKYIDGEFCGNNMVKTKRFPSLKTLELRSLSCLETWAGLVDGDMPLLQELIIDSCDMLISLPTLQFLNSLQLLCISSCQKLQDFPDERPPSSLNSMVIFCCPLLLEACEKEERENWRKIIKPMSDFLGSMRFKLHTSNFFG